jgi:hypothetical protein
MPINYAALKTELQTDPLNLGYATPLAAGNCTTPASLLNALTGPGAATITLTSMTNQQFVTAFLPYLGNVFTLSAPKQAFYSMIWDAVLAMSTISFANASVTGLMEQAVTDNLMTSPQATALTQRIGSRAEVLFGQDTIIAHLDIATALRS